MLKLNNYHPAFTVYFQPHDIDRILPQFQNGELDYYHLYLHGMRQPIAISIPQFEQIESFVEPGTFDLNIKLDTYQKIEITDDLIYDLLADLG